MNNLKKALGIGTHVLPPQNINGATVPYLGVNIPMTGLSEWDYSEYFLDQVKVQHPEDKRYANDRRAIHDMSMYNYMFGIPRVGFDIMTCNVIKTNPFFITNQSIVFDYLRQIKFNIIDKDGNRVDKLYNWLRHPNPQQSFWDVWIPAIGDVFAYDAGVVVATFSAGGWIRELRAYRGTEFWAEIDRVVFENNKVSPLASSTMYNISHGYITRWWQHSANNIMVMYRPEEVIYLMRYPQSGSIYGNDIMKYFKYNYRGLMSATVAYGKLMDNGLNTGVVFRHPDIGSISVLEERLSGIYKENTGPINYGKPLHLIGHEEVSTISNNTLADQQFIEGIKFNAQLIANIFGLPSSEFSFESSGGMSRGTAYNQKDIRKSRGIGTICSMIENAINAQVLPRLKGYEEGMYFMFEEYTDVDDQLKKSYVYAQQATTFRMLCPDAHVPPRLGLKLSMPMDDLSTEEKDMIEDEVQTIDDSEKNEPARQGRYDGDDYDETYIDYKDVSMVRNTVGALRHPESR